jgi:hypothetical protein
MKPHKCLSFFVLFCITLCNAQVGIGTTSPNAVLDIRSSNQVAPANTDGVLIPKVDAFPATNPTASQQGMLVFLTTLSGSSQPGFYYWNNPTTSWIPIGNTSTNNWALTGNTGTSSATNYFGTTDDNDIVFKRNGVRAGYIGNPNIASGNKNTSFGANTFNSTISGSRNAAFGTNVLFSNAAGSLNVAMGDQTMVANTSGSENTAIGVGSLYSNTQSNCNVAIGRNALVNNNGSTGFQGSNNTGVGYVALRSNTIGAYNTALGRESLYTNTTGNNNVGIGYQAGYSNSTGSSNVFLGNLAGYNETGSNKLYIENTSADATTALIYGDFNSSPKVLRTNSQFQIGDASTTGYKFPVGRGTNKQILETDGSGTLSWVNGTNTFSLVRTTLSASQGLGTGGWQKVNFNTVIIDSNSEFNTGTNRFTAAKAGYYRINAGMHTDNQGNTQFYSIGIYVNGTLYQEHTGNHNGSGPVSRSTDCIVNLAAGGYVEVYVQNYQGSVNIDSFPTKTFFEVQQIR